MHLCCPSVSASSYCSDFWSVGQPQVTPGRWLHFHKFQGSSGEKLKPVPRTREKAGRDQRWWMLVSVGVGLAMLGTRTAQKAHRQSVTAPAQLELTVRTQPLSMLVLRDISALSVPHKAPEGACKLRAWELQALAWGTTDSHRACSTENGLWGTCPKRCSRMLVQPVKHPLLPES